MITSAMRMNMFMHGIEEFQSQGDTLANPAFLEHDQLKVQRHPRQPAVFHQGLGQNPSPTTPMAVTFGASLPKAVQTTLSSSTFSRAWMLKRSPFPFGHVVLFRRTKMRMKCAE